MPRYIDAAPYEDGRIVLNKEDAGVPVAEIPTADVVERKKAKWFTTNTFMPDHYGGYYINQYVCTNCESEFFKASKYCPNCGADMRGGGGNVE